VFDLAPVCAQLLVVSAVARSRGPTTSPGIISTLITKSSLFREGSRAPRTNRVALSIVSTCRGSPRHERTRNEHTPSAHIHRPCLSLLIAAPAAAQKDTRPVDPDIENFGRVNATYFRGSQPQGEDYAALASLGVKTVINLIGDDDLDADERAAVERSGMRYVQIPMTTHRPPTPKQQEFFLSIVNWAENQPVYVRCVGGRHRTGVMTAIYRMTTDGLTGKEAFDGHYRNCLCSPSTYARS
jgi:protein tyrosine phosphatase (PTP) superfamily phosphohydrolase (DUF442 family)